MTLWGKVGIVGVLSELKDLVVVVVGVNCELDEAFEDGTGGGGIALWSRTSFDDAVLVEFSAFKELCDLSSSCVVIEGTIVGGGGLESLFESSSSASTFFPIDSVLPSCSSFSIATS